MPSPEDITGEILNLRKKGVLREKVVREALRRNKSPAPLPRRPFRVADPFFIFVYCALLLAAFGQFVLIVWMDLV